MRRRYVLAAALTFILLGGAKQTVVAQTSTKTTIAMHYLEGTVCDELGEPLPGAKVTVLMKDDEKNVTVTDQHGHFHLAANDKELAIIVSFVGYKDARQVVKAGKRKYDFSLQPNEAMMNEVAITGYNIIDKRRLTSAISSVTKEDLDFKGALTVDQMLEGKVAGLLTMTQSTTPGAAPKMRLRGSTTFTGSREPLWVIDGVVYENPVPVSADDINSLDNINLIGNAISGLNPQDIERIDVLKDASATAIYGTRAANGVIVVTTKSGHEGKPSINYAFNAQVTQRPHYSDFNLMTSKERIDVSREIMEKGLFFERVPERYGYEGAMMDYWDKNITYEQFQQTVGQLESNNTDWFGALYRNAFSQAHNVSISGGGSGTRYYASVGYDSDKGAERGTDLQRFTARMNLTTHIGENVTMDLRLSGSQQDAHYNSPYYSAFDEAYYTNRIFPAYNADGSFAYISKRIKEDQSTGQNVYGNYNVLHEYANSGQDIKNKSLNLTGTLNWEIIEGLRYTTTLGYTSTSNNTENWMGDNTFYCAQLRGYADEMPRADAFMQSVLQDGGIWSGSAIDQKSYLWRNQFNYHFDIHNIHQFNFDLGHEVTSTQYRGHNTGQVPGYSPEQGESFIPVWAGSAVDAQQYYWYLRQWFMGADTNPTAFPTITAKKNNKLSFYLTATYTFRNYFSLNFNARNDGSNQFGQYERAKFNPVWSASGRVNLHELAALKDVDWLNSLALRGSYGYRGSVPSATPYLIMTTPRKSSVSGELSASIHDYPNANLEWEKTSTWNLGLEASMLKDRINLGVDFYHSRSTDLISNRSVSLVNGTTSLFFNDGEATNTGVELTLNTLNIKTKDFRWRTSLIYSYNKNHVKRGIISTNTYADYINGTVILDGMSVDGFYSYRFDGLDRYGLPTFKGLTGNESGLSRDAFLQRLLTYSGTRTPRSYGSFSTEFSWKGVSLRAQFSYKFGYKQRLLALYEDGVSALPQPEDNMRGDFVHRWRTPGDEQHTSIPALTNASLNYRSNSTLTSYDDHYIDVDSQYATYSGPASYTGWYMYNNSDERVVNASHIRFRSLTLGYDLPKAWISKLKLTNCRIDFQAQNLCVWTFDKKLKGQDPDQVASIGMPVLPTFNFGIQVGF